MKMKNIILSLKYYISMINGFFPSLIILCKQFFSIDTIQMTRSGFLQNVLKDPNESMNI